MKPEDVYRIAEEVGLYDYRVPKLVLMDFAIQVASSVRAEEREACAETLENHPSYDFCRCVCECTEAIRARGFDL